MRWFADLFRHPDLPEERAELDAQQKQIATRLSKLTGKRRDDVLADAYRQGDIALRGKRES